MSNLVVNYFVATRGWFNSSPEGGLGRRIAGQYETGWWQGSWRGNDSGVCANVDLKNLDALRYS